MSQLKRDPTAHSTVHWHIVLNTLSCYLHTSGPSFSAMAKHACALTFTLKIPVILLI